MGHQEGTVFKHVLRRVRDGDAARMRALRLQMIADTPIAYVETLADAEAHPDEYWEHRAQERSTGCERSVFVVEAGGEDGEWIATAGGFAGDCGSTFVVGVFIAPPHRGTGVLEVLVEAVAGWSLECGREQLALEVARENPRAIAAYTRLGFTLTGEETPHPLYPGLTELMMARPARWP